MMRHALTVFPLVGALLLLFSFKVVAGFRPPSSLSIIGVVKPSSYDTPPSPSLLSSIPTQRSKYAAATTTTELRASNSNSNNNNNNNNEKTTTTTPTSSSSYYEYKDDCFGFMSFLAGGGTRDPVFAGFFVILSLSAAIATSLKWFPPDPKRNTIVDRKIPGFIALLTIILSSTITVPQELVDTVLGESIPPPIPQAKTIQYLIGGFSIVTAFLDIRWRDRFDYPEEFRD